ncbi:MAG: hypothetical protein AAF696_05605 [Bacteroidota bacterium]
MARYRIHIDPEQPSKAKMDAYKDFNSLHKRYKSQSRHDFWRRLYRNPRYFAILVALVSVSLLVYQTSLESTEQEAEAYILPPIPPKNIPSQLQLLPSPEAQSLTYDQGSRLHIPAGAFVDAHNQEIKGKIELHYREFRDAADMFIAGIPMDYDSAGKSYTLESAAMLEVKAYANGKEIFLKEGKSLEVEYFSLLRGNDFHVYHLDTAARNWSFEGKDLVRDVDENQLLPEKPELQYILDQEADTFLTRNVRIPNQKPGRVFQLSVSNAAKFSLLAGRENLIWEYIEMREFSDPWESGILPAKNQVAKAKPYRAAGVFLLEIGGRQFVARPLLKARSFQTEQAAYEARSLAYDKALAEYRAQQKLAQQQLKARQEAIEQYQTELSVWEESKSRIDSMLSKGVYRKFIIKKLGINQLGRKLNYPLLNMTIGIGLEGNESTGANKLLELKRLVMIHPEINTVFSCKKHPTEAGKYLLQLDPKVENLYCISDEEEKLFLQKTRKLPEDLILRFKENQLPISNHQALKMLILSYLEK